MFATVFAPLGHGDHELAPSHLISQIDAVNARVYAGLNDGVYRAGFAQTQGAHDEAVHRVFETLAWMNERLATQRYLCGDRLTEADVRAFPTLVRFDAAYTSAFGCSLARLVDYEHLWAYTRDLYQTSGFAETVLPLELYRRGYHSIPFAVGYRRIVPPMPRIDLGAPHGRELVGREVSGEAVAA
jgi:putative glutathione S-transferase